MKTATGHSRAFDGHMKFLVTQATQRRAAASHDLQRNPFFLGPGSVLVGWTDGGGWRSTDNSDIFEVPAHGHRPRRSATKPHLKLQPTLKDGITLFPIPERFPGQIPKRRDRGRARVRHDPKGQQHLPRTSGCSRPVELFSGQAGAYDQRRLSRSPTGPASLQKRKKTVPYTTPKTAPKKSRAFEFLICSS